MSAELLGIPMQASDRIEIYSGVARMAGKIWAALHRGSRPSKTVVVVVHPSSNFLGHYLLAPLAARGVDAVGLTTRYIGNDSSLIIENCVLDIGAAVSYLRERGYERIVLLGNSGGGGLIAMYQSQAESPTITATPAGDPPDLTRACLPAADALLAVMAHPGRAAVFTEFLDPAVIDEQAPARRDPELDLFGGRNSPPYEQAFLQRYRDAQLARNRRITAWVRDELHGLGERPDAPADLPFLVHGTIADPRFLDVSIDPSDRVPGTLWGPARQANFMPAALGRYTGLRSWLSQWSIDDSHCDGPAHMARTSVPVLVVYGTADQVCFPSHARAIYDAVPHDRKRLLAIAGGTHYLQGQAENVAILADEIVGWLADQGVHAP
jgi:alpha-beta hydrolase superfamily lysophospholipase